MRQGDPGAPLSAVQLRILAWTADGLTAPEIAAKHHYTSGTVRKHLMRIYAQLGASNAAHAVHLAHQRGLLGENPSITVVPAA